MPSNLLIRRAVGPINGANVAFTTKTAFASGTLGVLVNGRLVDPDLDDGFVESAPWDFTMKAAPRIGDVLFTAYQEA